MLPSAVIILNSEMIAMLYTRNSLQKIHILRTLQITEKQMGGTFIITISIICYHHIYKIVNIHVFDFLKYLTLVTVYL